MTESYKVAAQVQTCESEPLQAAAQRERSCGQAVMQNTTRIAGEVIEPVPPSYKSASEMTETSSSDCRSQLLEFAVAAEASEAAKASSEAKSTS